jgi:hypothetical protein
MPSSLEAAIVFALVIAPGFLLVRGYARRRTRSIPERDLYALAQAVIASIVWLGVAFFILQAWLDDWGLIPRNDAILEKNQTAVTLSLLGIVLLPYPLGWLAALVGELASGAVSTWLEGRAGALPPDPAYGLLKKTRGALRRLPKRIGNSVAGEVERSGLVTPPTASDKAWLTARGLRLR